MRIALVYNTFYYVAKFRLPLIKAFIADGHSVVVIAPPDDFIKDVGEAGAETIALPDMSSVRVLARNAVPIIFRLMLAIRKTEIDIVFSYTIFPNLVTPWVTKLLGASCYPNVAGLGSFIVREPNVGSKLLSKLYSLSVKASTGVFFQNRDDQCDLGMLDDHRAVLLPGSGVDVVRFSPSVSRFDHYDCGPINIIFVGRVLKQKGIIDFIRLSERLLQADSLPTSLKERLRFTVIGERVSEEREANTELDAAIDSGTIVYCRPVPPSEIESVYRSARFFVLPTTYGEGIPRTILEASSMGVPCLAYDWRGVREAIDDSRGGWLVEAGNLSDLCARLVEGLQLGLDEYRLMSDYARDAMKDRFSEDIVIAQYRAAVAKEKQGGKVNGLSELDRKTSR